MTGKMNDKRNKATESADTEESLQQELSRETTEGEDSIGDIRSNRTVTGSSSWETLPAKPDAGRSAPKSGKPSGKSSSTPPKRGKK
jgi:hypothetical protein